MVVAEQGDDGRLTRVASLAALRERGVMVVKAGGKQIALFRSDAGVYACNNRCPHEGYPLAEGTLTDGCILTCNWHNWKFDLEHGETLVGGDALRRYPVVTRGDDVWLDLTDPPPAEVAARALSALREAISDMAYDRMAREIARLRKAGADPADAIRAAVRWTFDRFEYGATHAHAAAADWLTLGRRYATDPAAKLVPVIETVAHLAWDSRREPVYPFTSAVRDFDADAFVAALDREDEESAVAMARGALAAGMSYADLEPALARAALAHYADFGHAAIYVYKIGQLVAALGDAVLEPLLLTLVRCLVYAYREELIPEFRGYGGALAAWDAGGRRAPAMDDFIGLNTRRAMARALESAADPATLHGALLGASAWNLLHFDMSLQDQTNKPVSRNVGWLDFTHAITFGNAVRALSERYPELWPQGLLQMACFVGRNAGYVDSRQDVAAWAVGEPDLFLDAAFRRLFDHGQFEYIVTGHLLKTLTAARAEFAARPDAPWAGTLLAGVNRFLHSPLKRKHALRTAKQSLDFVAAEG